MNSELAEQQKYLASIQYSKIEEDQLNSLFGLKNFLYSIRLNQVVSFT